MKFDVDKIIFQLLLLDGNETTKLYEVTYEKFKQLIVEVIKVKYDVRWCSNIHCQCWPESAIGELIKDSKLKPWLQEMGKKTSLYEQLLAITNNISEKTVWDKNGDYLRSGDEYIHIH